MQKIDYNVANNLIREKLIAGDSFSLVRNCNTMSYVLSCYLQNIQPDPQIVNAKHFIEMGIHPIDMNYLYSTVIPKTIEVTQNADILGFVDCSKTLHQNLAIQNLVGNIPSFFGDDFLVLDPVALLIQDSPYVENLISDPWTSALKNKRVLVISSHEKTITLQMKNMKGIWGSNLEKIAPFELVGVIRSPFHPLLDDRQYPGCNNWHETIDHMKKEIESYDFDVLLVGSAVTAPFFANHAKKMGKAGIHVGGTIQLFFGIRGYRWEKVEGYKLWTPFFNENWIHPLDEDKMQKNSDSIESCFAYW